MTDLSRWIGLPWAEGGRGPDSFDCWGLLVAVSSWLHGAALPVEPDPAAPGWRPVEAARFGDALWWPGAAGGHCGLAVGGGRALHAHARAGRSLISAVGGLLLPGAPRAFRWGGR